MANFGRFQCAALGLLAVLLALPAFVSGQDIESGQYYSDSLSTNNTTIPYYFQAVSNDTIIVRLADEDSLYKDYMPDCRIHYIATIPLASTNLLVASSSGGLSAIDIQFTATNSGWYRIESILPASLSAISNSFAYSISMLRMPDAPLSIADLDVGPMTSGQNAGGNIDVGADLDAVTFAVTNACRVEFRMGQMVAQEIPNVRLYDPKGRILASDIPPEYRAEISCFLTNAGIYTIVCNDQLNARGPYAVSLALFPGPIDLSVDPDFGPIYNGEIRTGTINQPGDLDIATFHALPGDTNILTMTKIDDDMNPRMELFDPTGSNLLAAAADVFHTTVSITATCTVAGTYYVICKDAEDRSNKKYTLSLTTLGGLSTTFVPDVPTGISATDGAYSNIVTISWGAVTNATGYDLWRSDGTNTLVYTWLVTNTPYNYYQDSNATPDLLYYYKVKSRNAYGISDFSASDSGYCGTVPPIPAGLTASDGIFSDYILVTWQSVTNATGYDLLRNTPNDSTAYGVLITNYPAGSYRDFSVLNNRQYSYKVKSRNIVGTSDFSASDSGYCVGANAGSSVNLHNDYDGDGFSDLAVYSESTGSWYIYSMKLGLMLATNLDLGGPGFHAITGDYDGDRKADLTVYSESAGLWRIGSLAKWQILAWDAPWGGPGKRPVVGDYDGDGIDDGALYETQHGFWYVITTFGRLLVDGHSFTGGGFTAVPGDYNGDGIADYALYHNDSGYWFILSNTGSNITWGTSWGGQGFSPVSGDYDGDGKSDLAVYNDSLGLWHIWSLARSRAIATDVSWGGPGFTPVPGDFNGDHKAELAIYQQTTGNWSIRTVDGSQQIFGNFGNSDYVPVKPMW